MKMENGGFMMNHYWNVSVLPGIRLGNTEFAPASRAGSIIKQQSSFGRTYLLPSYCSGSYLSDSGLFDADEQFKQSFSFSCLTVIVLILVLRKTSGFENKMSAPFPNPMV